MRLGGVAASRSCCARASLPSLRPASCWPPCRLAGLRARVRAGARWIGIVVRRPRRKNEFQDWGWVESGDWDGNLRCGNIQISLWGCSPGFMALRCPNPHPLIQFPHANNSSPSPLDKARPHPLCATLSGHRCTLQDQGPGWGLGFVWRVESAAICDLCRGEWEGCGFEVWLSIWQHSEFSVEQKSPGLTGFMARIAPIPIPWPCKMWG